MQEAINLARWNGTDFQEWSQGMSGKVSWIEVSKAYLREVFKKPSSRIVKPSFGGAARLFLLKEDNTRPLIPTCFWLKKEKKFEDKADGTLL